MRACVTDRSNLHQLTLLVRDTSLSLSLFLRHAAYIQGEVHGYIIHDEDHAAVGFFLTLTWPSGSSTRERAPKSEHLPDTALSALALRVYISTRAREEERERENTVGLFAATRGPMGKSTVKKCV